MIGSSTNLVIFIYVCYSHTWDKILRFNLCEPFQLLKDVNISFFLLFVIFLHCRQLDTECTPQLKCSFYNLSITEQVTSVLVEAAFYWPLQWREELPNANQEILNKNFIISPDKDEHSENGHEAQLVCSNWSNNVIKNEQYCQRRMWKTVSESKY